jgi:hypothetical protein
MKQDSTFHDSWYFHPSWALLCDHRALYSLQIGDRDRCSSLIQALWHHQFYIDTFVLVCIALPTIELAIHYSHFDRIEIATTFPTNPPQHF